MEHRETGRAPELRRTAVTALLAAACFSFAAHGFLFTNEFFSHDSVSYFTYSTGTPAFYASIGRFLIPLYERCKGAVAAPWLIGMLFTLWTAAASWLTARLLSIRSDGGIVWVCGLYATNLALTLTGATYVYCMDEYALSLCLAVLAAVLFSREGWRCLAGLAPLAASLALYQAYFTVAAALCLLAVMKRLADGAAPRAAVLLGARSLALLAAGFGLYYGLWTAVGAVLGAPKRRVEESILASGGGGFFALLRDGNAAYLKSLFDGGGVLGWLLPAVHALLLGLLLWRLFRLLTDGGLPAASRVLLAGLALLLPTAFHSAYLLLNRGATRLMVFADELLYLLPVLAMEPAARRRPGPPARAALAALLCCVLWQHAVFANQAYMKKELEKNATLALASQVVERIEAVEGYVPGGTAVAFAGRLDKNPYLDAGRDAFRDLEGLTGLWSGYAATYNLGRYLTDYLHVPLNWDQEAACGTWPAVRAMPAYPAAGSVAMVDGTVVVKLSEEEG